MICCLDDYDSFQSQSDAVKAQSQTLPTAETSESLGQGTSNPNEDVDLHADDKASSKVADDGEVLNLVKVKESQEPAEMEAGIVTKKEEDDEKHDVKISELLKSEVGNDVKKEQEKDDEDTLSESETAAAGKPVAATADSLDPGKGDQATNPIQKDDADDEMDHSAVPSPCPEVCGIITLS